MSTIKLVHLQTIDWSIGGGVHFSGKVKGFRHNLSDFFDYQVVHPLGVKECKRLNAMDGARGLSLHRPGDESSRFDTLEELCSAAVRSYKTHFPNAVALARGSGASMEPQRILDGPADFMNKANKIADAREKSSMTKAASERHRRYHQLIKQL